MSRYRVTYVHTYIHTYGGQLIGLPAARPKIIDLRRKEFIKGDTFSTLLIASTSLIEEVGGPII